MRKRLLLFFVVTLLLTGLSGCAVYRRPTPTPSTPNTNTTQVQPTVADQIVAQVNSISGVKTSYAVVIGNVALVGVDLKDKLTGDQENTLKTTIATQVKSKMPNLAQVLVSADPDLVVRIRTLASRIAAGEPISGFMQEITDLLKKLQPKSS